jgi:hypothetical protein
MKIRLFLTIVAAVLFCSAAAAQSVVITGKKITYKRPKPMSEDKKSFEINYPKIKAATPALSKRIEAAISYQSVLGLNLNDELRTFQWLETADYHVLYNKNGILSISLFMEGSGAYPSSTTKFVVVDLRTGLRAAPATTFSNTLGLLALVKKAKNTEVAQAIVEIKKDKENNEEHPEDLFKESAQSHPVKLDQFTVSDKGVSFHHDYGFAHVIQALQPTGEFFFTWAQLKPYIKAGGLLSRFKR